MKPVIIKNAVQFPATRVATPLFIVRTPVKFHSMLESLMRKSLLLVFFSEFVIIYLLLSI